MIKETGLNFEEKITRIRNHMYFKKVGKEAFKLLNEIEEEIKQLKKQISEERK